MLFAILLSRIIRMSGEPFPFLKKYSLTLKAKKITLTGNLPGNFDFIWGAEY